MKNNLITIGIIVLVAAGLFFVSKNSPVKNEVVNNSQGVGQGDNVDPILYKVKIIPPADWVVIDTAPNGVMFASADFQAVEGYKNITKGSLLSITVDENYPWAGLDEAIQEQTDNTMTEKDVEKITVDGQPAVRYSYKVGANNNNHIVVQTLKDGNLFEVEQQFSVNSGNPYPQILSDFIKGLKLPQ